MGTGLGAGIDVLLANEWIVNDHIYPAAQYGHDGTNSPPRAIGSGVVIQNGSDPALDGQFIFTDFPKDSTTMHVSLDDLLLAKTKLEDSDAPSELTPATIQRLGVLFDDDVVDATDLANWEAQYAGGGFLLAGQQVPEPTTLTLLLVSSWSLLVRRRRDR